MVIQPLQFSGKSWQEKIDDLRQMLNESDKMAMVVSEPDEIAWLFNMRGEGTSTIDSLMISPLFQSMALVTLDSVTLWVHTDKVDKSIREHLTLKYCNETNACVVIRDFSNATADLRNWAIDQNNVSRLIEKEIY